MLKIVAIRVGWLLAPILAEEAISGLKKFVSILKDANTEKGLNERSKKRYVIDRVASEVFGLSMVYDLQDVERPAE